MDTVAKIRKLLTQHFQPVSLDVQDDSYRHRNHTQAKLSGGGHYIVSIVSEKFADKSLLEQQRSVYDALGDLMHTEVHALQLHTKAP